MEIDLLRVSGYMVIPDLHWVVGGRFVVIILLVGWVRAARRGNRKSTSRKAAYMKMNKCTRFTAALATLIAAMTTSALAQKLDLATTKTVAEEAYIYGFPLVLNYKVFHDTFIDASAQSYKGPLNQIHNEARVYTPKDTAVQTPNSDTPYSLLGADLRAEPLVLCMPEIEKDRYYSVQMVDMYTHNYGYIGSRTTGNSAACYLLTGPDWKGETPAAINWPKATQAMFTTGFPVALDFLLQFLPPTGPAEVEKPLREKFPSIGIGPDKKVRLQDLAPEQKAALGEGIKQAFAKIEQRVAQIGLTANEIAANGPLPGEVSLYAKELACAEKLPTPGYYPSLNAAEIADGQRSGVFPCATFGGSFDGPNQVYAWRSADEYQDTAYINNRRPGELYIAGGANPPLKGPVPPGPFVAKADATTGKQVWRTYFENANASGKWLPAVNLNIMADGGIAFARQNNVALLVPDTGLILKRTTLPTGETPASQSGFKHLTIAPDGTLILKNQTRPTGYEYQGTLAIVRGVMEGFKQPNSHLVAVDPNTLEVLDHLSLPEPATVPHIVAMFEGKIAIYLGVDSGSLRYFWDPATKKLSQDTSWVIKPMQEGQSTADAPTVLGEWIILQSNGIGSKKVASSIVAVHQKDPTRMKVLFPFGPLKPGEWSFAPPKAGGDPENNMIYSADMSIGKVGGIKFDPVTGEMKTVFVVDDMTTAFQPLIGPKDKLVLLLSNMKKNVALEPVDLALFTANYKEQVTGRDAATGRLLGQWDFFEPMTFGSLITPGFGGRVYFSTGKRFMVWQALPKAKP